MTLHMRKHTREAEEAKVEPTRPAEVGFKKPTLNSEELDAKLKSIKSPADRERYLMALEKQEEFRQAPDALVGEDLTDEHWELRKLYAPETIEHYDNAGNLLKKAERHAYVGDRKKADVDVARGYVPVFDRHGRQVCNSGGDLLYSMDQEKYDMLQAKYAKQSKDELASAEKKMGGTMDKGTVDSVDADIPSPDPSGVRMEQVTSRNI